MSNGRSTNGIISFMTRAIDWYHNINNLFQKKQVLSLQHRLLTLVVITDAHQLSFLWCHQYVCRCQSSRRCQRSSSSSTVPQTRWPPHLLLPWQAWPANWELIRSQRFLTDAKQASNNWICCLQKQFASLKFKYSRMGSAATTRPKNSGVTPIQQKKNQRMLSQNNSNRIAKKSMGSSNSISDPQGRRVVTNNEKLLMAQKWVSTWGL